MVQFELSVEVEEKHIDALSHVNNIVYLQWVQEVAGAHWFSVAGKNSGYIWVVRKHEIEYFKPAFKGDILSLRTWVEKMEGFRSIRRVDILRGEEILCSCTTNWIALDSDNLRPKRIEEPFQTAFE